MHAHRDFRSIFDDDLRLIVLECVPAKRVRPLFRFFCDRFSAAISRLTVAGSACLTRFRTVFCRSIFRLIVVGCGLRRSAAVSKFEPILRGNFEIGINSCVA